MSFFDKFAKLQSSVDESGDAFTVNVFDDEVSTEKPAMWLKGYVDTVNDYLYGMANHAILEADDEDRLMDEFDYVVYVDIVNVDNSIYFELPENRKNTCATSLFKRFIKFYKENYSGQLVVANFQNFDLQEKFKLAAEKGIFPKESLELIGETTKSDYDNDPKFNINNRETQHEALKVVIDTLQESGLDAFLEGQSARIRNGHPDDIFNAVEMAITKSFIDNEDADLPNVETFLLANLQQSGDYIFNLPIAGYSESKHNIIYDGDSRHVDILNMQDSQWILEYILENEEAFRNVFNNVNTIADVFGAPTPVDEFFAQNKTTASHKINRLIKKSTK